MSSRRNPHPPPRVNGSVASTPLQPRLGSASISTHKTDVFSLVRPSTSSTSARRCTADGASNLTSRNRDDVLPVSKPSSVQAGSSRKAVADLALVSQDSTWRSDLIQLEVALKELVADGPTAAPTTTRIQKVLSLFDSFTTIMASHAPILRLFRVEFCRAIFSYPGGGTAPVSSSTAGMGGADLSQLPYFERVSTVSRESAILQAELNAMEADSSVDELKKQISKLQSLISFYEHEVSRLTRENKKATEEITRMVGDAEVTARQHQSSFATLDDEVHRLSKENRELQLQVFRLGKETRDQLAGHGLYSTLKQSKFEALQRMLTKGNEQASLLLLLNQLEAQMNKALDEFEAEILKSSTAEVLSLRSRLVKRSGLLLEEYHKVQERMLCLAAYGRLQQHRVSPRSAPAASLLAAAEHMLGERAKGAVGPAVDFLKVNAPPLKENVAAGGRSTSCSAPPAVHPPSQGDDMQCSAITPVHEAANLRRRWVAAVLAPKLASSVPDHMQHHLHEPIEPGRIMHRDVVAPLLDMSATKFMAGIEVHSQSAGDATFLRAVNYVDPSAAIELPPRTTHVKLKFTNPMMRPAIRRFVAARQDPSAGGVSEGECEADAITTDPTDLLQLATEAELRDDAVLDWLPRRAEATGLQPQRQQRVSGSPPASPKSGSSSPSVASVPPEPVAEMEAAHWAAFRRLFLSYRPHLPRFMDIHHIDLIMLQTFVRHTAKLMQRYESCSDIAMQRSTGTQMARMLAERFFRDGFRTLDVQHSMLEVLEARYVFPELVMKVAFETLQGLERTSSSHAQSRTYLGCLAGTIPPSSGFLLASMLHKLSSVWPLPTSQSDTSISERDLGAVLRCLYPMESNAVKISSDDVLNDVVIGCRKHLTLQKVKEHTALSILARKEPICAKFNDMLMFRASAVHWTELDHSDFWETTRHILLEDMHDTALVKFLNCSAVLHKSTRVPPSDLAHIAAEIIWMRDGSPM